MKNVATPVTVAVYYTELKMAVGVVHALEASAVVMQEVAATLVAEAQTEEVVCSAAGKPAVAA